MSAKNAFIKYSVNAENGHVAIELPAKTDGALGTMLEALGPEFKQLEWIVGRTKHTLKPYVSGMDVY